MDDQASNPHEHGVHQAQPSDLDLVAATLAKAFVTTPLFHWLLDHRDDPEPRLLVSLRALLRLELSKPDHLVDTIDRGAGVALWYDVDRWRHSTWESARLLPSAMHTYGKRLKLAGQVKSMVDDVHPTKPHRYLAYIGVRPEQQGNGLGNKLLASATARCDADGVAAYLENLDPRNTPLYQRFGFVEGEPIKLPPGAPAVVPMWRDPA